jgi:hypothetical protein
MDVIADAVLVEELVELLVIDTVRSLDLTVQAGCARANVNMPDVAGLDVPMKLRLELGAVIGLNDVDAERQSAHHLVNELDRRALIARVEDLEDPDPRAIVNRGELKQPSACPGDALEELDVYLQAVPRHGLLVSLPAFAKGPMALIGRQATHSMPLQNAVDGGSGDLDLVETM